MGSGLVFLCRCGCGSTRLDVFLAHMRERHDRAPVDLRPPVPSRPFGHVAPWWTGTRVVNASYRLTGERAS